MKSPIVKIGLYNARPINKNARNVVMPGEVQTKQKNKALEKPLGPLQKKTQRNNKQSALINVLISLTKICEAGNWSDKSDIYKRRIILQLECTLNYLLKVHPKAADTKAVKKVALILFSENKKNQNIS